MDVEQVVGETVASLREVVGSDWNAVAGFADKQAKLLATQAAWIAESRVLGALREDYELFEFFSKQLERMTLDFARSLSSLTLLTVEKAWNLVAGVLWKHVNLALGGAGLGPLPMPQAPAA